MLLYVFFLIAYDNRTQENIYYKLSWGMKYEIFIYYTQ